MASTKERFRGFSTGRTIELLALAVVFVVLAVVFHGFAVKTAGGSDSYGYASEALGLNQGHFYVPERVLSPFGIPENTNISHPLGYISRGPQGLIPTYPFGYPMLMVVAMRIEGFPAIFWITPILAAGTVVITFLLARRLVGVAGGFIAVLLTVLLPNFLWSSFEAFSDVPATFFAALALLLLLEKRARPWHDFTLGAAIGLAIWIRPNMSLLVVPVGAWLVWCRDWGRLLRFGVSLLPFVVVEATINAYLYGAPWRTGYGEMPFDRNLSTILARGVRHLRRLQDQQVQIGLPLVILGFLVGQLDWPRRVLLASIGLLLLLFFAFYAIDDAWWYGRFLLPGFPAVVLLETSFVVRLIGWRRSKKVSYLATAIAAVPFAFFSLGYSQSHGVFDVAKADVRYATAAQYASKVVQQPALVMAMQHSGTLRLYGGLSTLRYDLAPVPFLLHLLYQVRQHGGSVYFVGDGWEVDEIQRSGRGALLADSQEVGRIQPGDVVVLKLNPPLIPSDLSPQHRIQARLGDSISLLGFDVSSSAIRQGGTLTVTLYCTAISQVKSNYTVFVHVDDDRGKILAQSDSYPVEGHYPTSQWTPGYVVADVHHILIPATADGTRHVTVGLYQLETMRRLPIFDQSSRPIGDQLRLTDVTIE